MMNLLVSLMVGVSVLGGVNNAMPTGSVYTLEATATDYDGVEDFTFYTDWTGNVWTDTDNYKVGQSVVLIMDDMGTETIYDDCILAIVER